jgi:propionyl-CoA carboxylase beta chain
MVRGTSYMFVTGPNVVKTVTHEVVDMEGLGGADVHASTSGVAHFACDGEMECLESIRTLLRYLPQNNREDPPRWTTTTRRSRGRGTAHGIVPDEPSKPYDMNDVIRRVVDHGVFYEVHRDYRG